MCSIERLRVILRLELDARIVLDKYSYDELRLACEDGLGSLRLLNYLQIIFISIIEDWIQHYLNERQYKKNDLYLVLIK
jgi:hypothetical protein